MSGTVKTLGVFGVALAVLSGVARDAGAQGRRAQWGVSLGITPSWSNPEVADPTLESLWGGTNIDFSGSELRAGFVRGTEIGGDFGISFVRRPFADGSSLVSEEGDQYVTRGVVLNGIELHRFAPFGTIRDRVQIGLDFGAGVGVFGGEADGTAADGTALEEVVVYDALSFRGSRFIPLARMEFALAVIATPELKVRMKAGINFPGVQAVSLTVNYLFGDP